MKYTIFKRKIYAQMLEWKQRFKGGSALLIEGARRIGKSTIAEDFAKREYEDYLIIDFSNTSKDFVELFDYTHDLTEFFMRLQLLIGRKMPVEKSVIILDEIQFCPKARQAIKHLVKDGRYDYIETGSLISIKRNVRDILIPSEEHRIEMYPMDFEEFLWALGKTDIFEVLRYKFEKKEALGNSMHRSMMKEFRLYMLVGGMPQSVNTYIQTADFEMVDTVKRGILDLYYEDFRKIDSSGRLSTVFGAIPSVLSQNTSRFMIGSIIEGARPSRSEEIFADLNDSKTVNFTYHANNPDAGLALHSNYDNFKIYLGDTGLFVTMVFKDRNFTENIIYNKLLFDKMSTDMGFIYENVVAQMLKAAGHSLYYYTFRERNEEGIIQRSYEIDFVISQQDKIAPIEVKSSAYKAHKSLDKFHDKFSSRIRNRYLIYTKDYKRDGNMVYLPVYMTGLL